jgi:hypothetical protein
MTTMSLPIVSTCSATSCAYNHDTDCHAGAITVTGDASSCGTFVEAGDKAGTDSTASVGACHRSECVFNSSLECTAKDVAIDSAGDTATCQTFQAA